MKSWRLSWVYSQISDRASLPKYRRALHSPWKFWVAILFKLVPGLWPFDINLRLKQGGIVTVREFMTLFVLNEIFVEGCYDVPISTCPEPVIMDVGANTGLFILRMKQRYPHARVLAYEPLPSNYTRLERTVALNQLNHCETFMRGVGSATRTERLYIHPKNVGGHSILRSVAGDGHDYTEIDIVDIAEELDRLAGKSLSLLKLDCEGAEYEILKRINGDMAGRIEKIVFESTPSIYDVNELVGHLTKLGYQVTTFRGLHFAQYRGRSE